MNFKKYIFAAFLALGCLSASAQEEVKTEYVFNPHWYIQGQFGVEHTLGEVSYGVSPNAQLGVGYQWNKIFGTRLVLNAWQSKGGSHIQFSNGQSDEYKWKWNFVAPSIDMTMNVSNALFGYNPERPLQFSIFAGPGVNFAFNNDEAKEAQAAINSKYNVANPDQTLRYIWDGSQVSIMGHMGAMLDYRINDAWSVGFEFAANVLSDKYNSKKAENADWYFTYLAGVKYNLGKTHTKKTTPLETAPCEPTVVEKIVEKIVEVPVKVEEPKREAIRRDIFFLIRGSQVSSVEMAKLDEIAIYMNKYPESKVTVTGYADKGTGSAAANLKYAQNRAKVVADLLQSRYGLSASRIIVDAKGDTVQPYEQNELNRVTICIAE